MSKDSFAQSAAYLKQAVPLMIKYQIPTTPDNYTLWYNYVAASMPELNQAIDQAIKLWATNVLQPVGAMPLIPHVVELRFVLNPGMAFSLLSGKQLFLIAATSAALLLVAYALFFRSRGKYLQQAALILVLGGGIGNLIDRVLNGEVVDYINLLFMRFAVFNFADICVCVGVALWVLVIFLDELHADDAAKEQ